jgi:hypothetical protein
MQFSSKNTLFVIFILSISALFAEAEDIAQIRTAVLVTQISSTGSNIIINAAANELATSIELSLASTISFNGQNAGSSPMVLDGKGLRLSFARVSSPLFIIAPGKTVRLTNIVLKYLSPEHLSLGAGSRLLFGDNVYIQLSDASTALTYSWIFDGVGSVIDGRGKSLRLSVTDALLINDNKDLTLKDMSVFGLKTTGTAHTIRCEGSGSRIFFDDATLYPDIFFNIAQGNATARNTVTVRGKDTKLAWTSLGSFTIDPYSMLKFDYGTTFSYDSPAITRNKFVMTDYSSLLHLNNATFHATRPGLVLAAGSVFLENAVVFSSEGQLEAESLRIDSLLKVYVPLGASLEVRGKVVYQ